MSGQNLLTIAPNGCTLTPAGLDAQAARAATLRNAVRSVDRSAQELSVTFGADVDDSLVTELVETERGCCSFLTIDYDGGTRVLRIAARDPEGAHVLDVFGAVFGRQEKSR